MEEKNIPIEDWGKDHWSLLAYIECRCVDYGGIPSRDHMRINEKKHPGLANRAVMGGMEWSSKYGTRLNGFWKNGTTDPSRQLPDHDDWDCLYDLEAAGLIKDNGTGIHPLAEMTPKGREIAALLRAHKAEGGQFAGFAEKFAAWQKEKVEVKA